MPNNTIDEFEHVWHLFVIRSKKRDELQKHLTKQGVQTLIHYLKPPHKQEAYAEFENILLPITDKIHDEVLSIPISPVLTEGEVGAIIKLINLYE